MADKADLIEDVMAEIGELDGVTYADLVFFDTKVYKNTDRSGTEYINGGTSFTELLGEKVGAPVASERRQGDLFDQATQAADSGG